MHFHVVRYYTFRALSVCLVSLQVQLHILKEDLFCISDYCCQKAFVISTLAFNARTNMEKSVIIDQEHFLPPVYIPSFFNRHILAITGPLIMQQKNGPYAYVF